MSKTWQAGDVIQAEDMNRLESAGENVEVVQIVTASLKMGSPKWAKVYSETNYACYSFTYGCNFDNGTTSTNLNQLTSGRKIIGVYALKKKSSGENIAGFNGVTVDVTYSSEVHNLLSVPTSDYARVTQCQISGMLNYYNEIDTTTGVDLYAIVVGDPQEETGE